LLNAITGKVMTHCLSLLDTLWCISVHVHCIYCNAHSSHSTTYNLINLKLPLLSTWHHQTLLSIW